MTEANPYLGPTAPIVNPPLVLNLASAPKVRRFFNWIIDTAAIVGLIVALTLVAAVIGGEAVLVWLETVGRLIDYAIGSAVTLVYYTLMEGVLGYTIGKLITGTRVVDAQGRRLTFARASLRSLCRLIPFDAFSLLLSDDDVNRAWHDSLPRTFVVMRRRESASA